MTGAIEKMKKWLNVLKPKAELSGKKSMKDLSPFLASLQNSSIEIPGQYYQVKE